MPATINARITAAKTKEWYAQGVLTTLLAALICAGGLSCQESLGPKNHRPVISDIIADPPVPTVVDTVSLTVVASDSDGDSLSFAWQVSSGGLLDTTGVSVRWATPATSGEHTVQVDVSDGKLTAHRSRRFSTQGTVVAGDIWGEWHREGSPYIVVGDCRVGQLADLTVESGVEVRVRGPWKILVYGGLTALGTEQDRVTFTSDSATPWPGDWKGIEFGYYDGPGPWPELPFPNELRWTVVEYAETGVDAQSGWTAPTIENCVIRRNSKVGVFAGGGESDELMNVVIRNTRISENGVIGVICTAPRWEQISEASLRRCYITDNGYAENSGEDIFGGVYCSTFRGEIDSCAIVRNGTSGSGFGIRIDRVDLFPEFHNCILQDSGSFDLICHHFSSPLNPTGGILYATRNYWGEATTAEMEEGGNPRNISTIYDRYDNDLLWEVDYSDWLSEAPEIPEP